MSYFDINYELDQSNIPSNFKSDQDNLSNHENTIYDNTIWEKTSNALKRMSLLQGLPLTLYSYAAGIFRSNSKFGLYGIIDLFTYVSRKNILGSINLRPDITFTFLNKKNIIDNYISTYNNGLFGSALNVFMNYIDFNTMDNIIDNSNNNLDTNSEISFNLISKLSVNSLTNPDYYKIDNKNKCVLLNENKILKNTSIIYGGPDYEQIACILNIIPNYNSDNITDTLPDTFLNSTIIFHYYIEPNYDKIISISNNLLNDLSMNFGDNSYNNIVNNYFSNIDNSKINYSYGQILFFKEFSKVKKIYLPIIDSSGNYKSEKLPEFCCIYNSEFDNNKKYKKNAIFHLVLMPVSSGDLKNGICNFNNQLIIEKNIRNNYSIYNFGIVPHIVPDLILNYDISNIDWNFSTCYTILCGLDDNLSYKYLDNVKIYPTSVSRFGDNQSSYMSKIYLCYYDGNSESFKKVLTSSNNPASLDYFNNVNKVISYNINNNFTNSETENLINKITSFVYNINEGKAVDINVVKNNPITYNNGIILGIDCVLLIYLTQLYYNDYSRIFSSKEIFDVYYNLITSNNDYIDNKVTLLNNILQNRFTYYSSTNIYDNYNDISYTNLTDISCNSKDEFFIFVSELLHRNFLTLNQKSYYKIIKFNNTNYINNLGNLLLNFNNDIVTTDYKQFENKWYDVTYKLINNYNDFSNNANYFLENINSINSICQNIFYYQHQNSNKDIDNIAFAINNCILYFENDDFNSRSEFYNTLKNNDIPILFENDISNVYNDIVHLQDKLDYVVTINDLIQHYIKILLLFSLNNKEFYQLNNILDAKYDYNIYNIIKLNKKYDIIKLNYKKSYLLKNYNFLTKSLNFTVIDIFDILNNNYDISNINIYDLSDNINLNVFDNISTIKLLKYVFTNTSSFFKHNLLQLFANLITVDNSLAPFNFSSNNTTNIFSNLISLINKLNNANINIENSLNYKNEFITLPDELRYNLLNSYYQTYN
tara:strand:+ start:1843 stop:4812 length:2970 start_codon:yes stop_codon:yes gene_type:complete